MVTSCFENLKLVVMESWIHIPEEYDEIWNQLQNADKAKGNKADKADKDKLREEVEGYREKVRQMDAAAANQGEAMEDINNVPNSTEFNHATDTPDCLPEVALGSDSEFKKHTANNNTMIKNMHKLIEQASVEGDMSDVDAMGFAPFVPTSAQEFIALQPDVSEESVALQPLQVSKVGRKRFKRSASCFDEKPVKESNIKGS